MSGIWRLRLSRFKARPHPVPAWHRIYPAASAAGKSGSASLTIEGGAYRVQIPAGSYRLETEYGNARVESAISVAAGQTCRKASFSVPAKRRSVCPPVSPPRCAPSTKQAADRGCRAGRPRGGNFHEFHPQGRSLRCGMPDAGSIRAAKQTRIEVVAGRNAPGEGGGLNYPPHFYPTLCLIALRHRFCFRRGSGQIESCAR